MAKRGRPRKGEVVTKNVRITARVAPDIKAHLAKSAEQNGVTMAQEIETRLRRAAKEDRVTAWFGGEKNYSLFRLCSMAVRGIKNPERIKAGREPTLVDFSDSIGEDAEKGEIYDLSDFFNDWTADPYVFAQYSIAINYCLYAFGPDGDSSINTGSSYDDRKARWQGLNNAWRTVLEVQAKRHGPKAARGKTYSAIYDNLGFLIENSDIDEIVRKWKKGLLQQLELIEEIQNRLSKTEEDK